MSLTADPPVHSSSSDDFARSLDAELGYAADASPDFEAIEEKEVENVVDDNDDYKSNHQRYSNKYLNWSMGMKQSAAAPMESVT